MGRNGSFIAIEGLDGAGKSTIVDAIDETYGIVQTQEPSELWTGKQVRRALQSDTAPFMDFNLFMADRHHHIEKTIKPAVEDGEIVVSDRYADSTRAYQPYQLRKEMKNPHGYIRRMMEPWTYEPDLVIYVDIGVDTALERSSGEDKYEHREMLEEVKQNYNIVVAEGQEDGDIPYVVIDGEQDEDAMVTDALDAVGTHLEAQ